MAQITETIHGQELVLSASGRIDSTNAPEIEAQIKRSLDNPHNSVVLDVDALEYISSAGLRIVLRLRKDEPSLKIINANAEVYDILEMTGFTEMMTVEKAYRKISIEGCEVIGQGANGKVYRIDPDTIVKYYIHPDALPDIQRERELARKAFILGIPTAIPYDVVRVGDGYGSVFELLNADSFLKLIVRNPEDIDKYVGYSVDVLKKMHATDVNPADMPDQKPIALGWVKDIYDTLPEETAKKLQTLFDEIPSCNKMMHGDYHFKNIMMQNDEVLLIDMDTLCHGDPIFEFAAIYNAYVGFSAFETDCIEKFMGITAQTGHRIWNKTIELYFGTTDRKLLDEIEEKVSLVSFTRLYRRCLVRGGSAELTQFNKNKVIALTEKVDSLVL